jgi:8-oxo-dGTP diphosphatase
MALKHVAAAIVIKEGKVLVTRRGPGETLEGHWEFPGGKLECDERPQDCIVRELAEELGVSSIAGDVYAQSIYEYPGGAILLISFAKRACF